MRLSFQRLALALALAVLACAPAIASTGPSRPTATSSKRDEWKDLWETSLTTASAKAKQQDRLILAYFRGSDWCPWCQKLEKEVLKSPAFMKWAKEHVVALDVDFPSAQVRQPATIKQQNERLKDLYNVTRTPTFILLDPQGEEVARAGYDEAKLRPDEKIGEPVAWMKYLDELIAKRPDGPNLVEQPDLIKAVSYAKSKARPVLMLVTRPDAPPVRVSEVNEKVLKDPKFVKFTNRHLGFVRIAWPKEDDHSRPAAAFRAFAKTYNLPPAPLQFVLWDPGSRKILDRETTFTTARIDPFVQQLQKAIPTIDYAGTWLEDYRLAQAIATQQERDIFILFTDSEASDWSKRLDDEILKTEPFRQYAGKNLVLVRVDFAKSKHARKSPTIKEQHETLADQHGVRGYPFIVVLNPKMQKIGEAKYMKGGPEPFLKELDLLRKKDQDRRNLASDQVAKEMKGK